MKLTTNLCFMLLLRILGALLPPLMPVFVVTISIEISIVYLVYTLCLTRTKKCVENINVFSNFI